MTITITFNGEAKELERPMSVREFVDLLAIPSPAIAVEVNLKIIRRQSWEAVQIQGGDRVEVVTFVGGG